jgi:hypothetical protein
VNALQAYLADPDGRDWLESGAYEVRRSRLVERMAREPVTLMDVAAALVLPLSVACDLVGAWRAIGETVH